MNTKKKILYSLLFLASSLLFPASSFAQFTQVTATVKDPNGIPYANGTMSAVLVPTSAGGWTLSGNPYSGRVGPLTLDSTGTFVANFGSNAIILPAATKWQITVNSNQGGIAAPLGTGAQTFTVTMTISGATQNISATLNAAAPSLTNFLSAGGVTSLTATSPIVATPSPIVGVGVLSCPTCVTASGGGSIAITANQVAFGTGANAIGGSANLTWVDSTQLFTAQSSACPLSSFLTVTFCGNTGSFGGGPVEIIQTLAGGGGLFFTNSNSTGNMGTTRAIYSFINQTTLGALGIGQQFPSGATGAITFVGTGASQGAMEAGTNEPDGVSVEFASGPFSGQLTAAQLGFYVDNGGGTCYINAGSLGSGLACIGFPNAEGTPSQFDFPTTDPTIFHSFLVSNVTGGQNVTTWAVPGVAVNAQTGASYTLAASSASTLGDRGSLVTTSNGGAIAVTLPQAGTAGYANNYNFGLCNIGAGTATITPTTSTINGAASLALVTNECAYVYSDNTNYFATVDYYGLPPASSGANTALSNLAAVAINAALLPGSTNTIALGNASHLWTNVFSTALNCGLGGTTSCVITGNGSTSGTATFTWPAVAGTATNPILISNSLQLPSGTVYNWNADTGLSRNSAAFIYAGNGTAGDHSAVFRAATFDFDTSIENSNTGANLIRGSAPTIASGFGTSPSIPNNNGTAAFTVNVGTGGAATSGVITMPAATIGWACHVAPNGAPQAAAVTYSAPTSSTSITLTNYTLTTGVALAWTASTVLQVSCFGY